MAFAAPHVQNLDEALQLNIYVGECQRVLTGDVRKKITDAENELAELLKVRKSGDKGTTRIINNVEFTAADRKAAREKCLNKKKVNKKRKWLQNLLLAESSSEDESNPKVDDMVRLHKVRLRCLEHFYQKPKLRRFKYYGANLIVNNNDVVESSTNLSLLPATQRAGNNRLNGGGKRTSSSSSFFAHSEIPTGYPSTSNISKISPRKTKRKKQPPPPLPVIPVTSSLTVPEIMPQTTGSIPQLSVQPQPQQQEIPAVVEPSPFTNVESIPDLSQDQVISTVLGETSVQDPLPGCGAAEIMLGSSGTLGDLPLNVPLTSVIE